MEQSELRARREQVVHDHIDAENRQDVEAVIATFDRPRYDVKPLGSINDGADSVHELMSGLFAAFPDFTVDVQAIHHGENAVIVEEVMSGTHQETWAGVPATGRRMSIPVCCVFDFEDDRLVTEHVYFDLATILIQLGAMPAPGAEPVPA